MKIVVKLFGAEAELAGAGEVAVELPEGADCAALRARLAEAHAALAPALRSARFARNHAFADDAETIEPGDEVALIGLVSGG